MIYHKAIICGILYLYFCLKEEVYYMRKRRTILIFSLIAAICSTVALLADVETTGNLSMALNGDTIVSFIMAV